MRIAIVTSIAIIMLVGVVSAQRIALPTGADRPNEPKTLMPNIPAPVEILRVSMQVFSGVPGLTPSYNVSLIRDGAGVRVDWEGLGRVERTGCWSARVTKVEFQLLSEFLVRQGVLTEREQKAPGSCGNAGQLPAPPLAVDPAGSTVTVVTNTGKKYIHHSENGIKTPQFWAFDVAIRGVLFTAQEWQLKSP